MSSEELESDSAISSGDGMKAVGDDGLLIKEIEGTSPDVQLVGHAYTFDTNQEVIETMSAAYMPDTVFFSKEFGAPENVDSADTDTLADARVDASRYAAENALTESGIQEVQREADGDMTIRIDADADDWFLLINEYDDGQWSHMSMDRKPRCIRATDRSGRFPSKRGRIPSPSVMNPRNSGCCSSSRESHSRC